VQIGQLAVKSRLPTMFANREFVEAGDLMTYGANFADMFRRAATYVDKIFKGANPADLAIEQPTRFSPVGYEQPVERVVKFTQQRALAASTEAIKQRLAGGRVTTIRPTSPWRP
jgi:ABC-type uncharacterized transport system substrate-binding protein